MSYTITKEQTLYTFEELDKAGQDTAVSELLQDPWFFWTDIDAHKSWIIDPYFTNGTRPEWQADFSFTQGDGLNLYGDLSFNDLRAVAHLKPIKEDFVVSLPPNRRYTYSLWNVSYEDTLLNAIYDERGAEYAHRQRANVKRICAAMHVLAQLLREYGEWCIFEGYYDASIYEGQLFDECGHWVCSVDDIEGRN